jgi:predicted PurR-regulated permease PerM
MNLESFTIGVVTVLAVLLVFASIVGIVKVFSLTKQLFQLQRRLEEDEQQIVRISNECHQHADDVSRDLHGRINDVDRHIEDVNRQIMSYTDSRFDKILNRIDKKQVLKD